MGSGIFTVRVQEIIVIPVWIESKLWVDLYVD